MALKEEYKKEYRNVLEKILSSDNPFRVWQFFDEDLGDAVGIFLCKDEEEWDKIRTRDKEWAIKSLGLDELTLEFIKNTTPEERVKLGKLARLKALKDEVETLENELARG